MIDPARDLLVASDGGRMANHTSGYHHFTRALRLILGLGALAILFFVFLWPSLKDQNLSKDMQAVGTPTTNEVVSPQFDAVDDQGQPYKITAARAVQDATNPDIIHLEKPRGDLAQTNGITITLVSERGTYDQAKKILDLMGNVTLSTSDGYTLTTDVAQIQTGPQIVTTVGVARATGPEGTIEGTKLSANGQTGTIMFHGPATLMLNEGVW